MKRSAAYIGLLLAVIVVAAVLSVRVLTREQAAPEETPASAETQSIVLTLPPEETPARIETPQPTETETPSPTKTPQPTETEHPFETRAPIAAETPIPMDKSGSFRSDTGTYLNLLVDWGAYGTGDTVTLTVRFSVESYSFYTSALYHSLELRVNGETYYADSPQVSYDGAEQTVTPMTTFTVSVPRGTASLEALWHYKGSYSGVELSDISAAATIDLS